MLDYFYPQAEKLKRLRFGPLGPHLDGYANDLFEKGYSNIFARQKLRLAATFSRWLYKRKIMMDQMYEQRSDEFLRCRRKKGRLHHSDQGTLRQLLKYLKLNNLVPIPTPVPSNDPRQLIEKAFKDYLQCERGLAPSTVVNYCHALQAFLRQHADQGTQSLARIGQRDINRFILDNARAAHPQRARMMVTALRCIFRFLHQRGITKTDFSVSVPHTAYWRLAEIPKFIEPEEVETLLTRCDRSTPMGIRDHAVLLLLARLGLRAGEVANLILEDIDWQAGELRVWGKTARQDRLPIPKDVGAAVAKYLRDARPHCSSRRVFIRTAAPYEGFSGAVAIGKIVQRALARAELNPPFKGAHLLRFSLATRMLRHGATLAEIGEILRHQQACTTEIYAKVDMAGLPAVAQPWPGGAK